MLVEQGTDLELNQSVELDRAVQNLAAAALFFHEPQQLRLPSFDAKSPFKGAQTLLVGQPAPAGARIGNASYMRSPRSMPMLSSMAAGYYRSAPKNRSRSWLPLIASCPAPRSKPSRARNSP